MSPQLPTFGRFHCRSDRSFGYRFGPCRSGSARAGALLPVPALLPELPEDGDDGVVLCAATHAVQQSRIKLNRIDFVIVNTPVFWC